MNILKRDSCIFQHKGTSHLKGIIHFHFWILVFIVICSIPSCSQDNNDESVIGDYDNYPYANKFKGSLSDIITFIHISDTHGSSICLTPAIELMKYCEYDFGILTGDILPSGDMLNSIRNSSIPFLMVPGNHDAYDGVGQHGFRKRILNGVTDNNNVVFDNTSSNFWYKDFKKSGYNLRVIGLDEFEIDDEGRPEIIYSAVWTQKQIDWFINLLNNSGEFDGIIVLIHEGFGNSKIGSRDINNSNDFISILAKKYTNSYDYNGVSDPLLIPDIVNAYITGVNIDNKEYLNGNAKNVVKVNTTFTKSHNNFIGYFGGHLHWDEVEYLKNYTNQLQVLMAYCGSGTGSSYNDLIKTGEGKNSYNMNLNVINFREHTFKIYRIGANTKSDNTTRDSISFKYKDN